MRLKIVKSLASLLISVQPIDTSRVFYCTMNFSYFDALMTLDFVPSSV